MTILNQYAKLKIQRDLIDTQLEEIKEAVTNDVLVRGGKVDTRLGSFYISTMKEWRYPSRVLQAIGKKKAEIKALEIVAQSKSSYKPIPRLNFSAK